MPPEQNIPEMNYFPDGTFGGSPITPIESRLTNVERLLHSHKHTTKDRTQPLDSATTSQTFTVFNTWPNTTPQTANNFYGGIWLANVACTVTSIKERHEDSATGGACTVTVYKNGSTSLLSSGFDVTANAGSTNTGTLTATTADLIFAVGDRLNVGISASRASLTGVNIVVEFTVN